MEITDILKDYDLRSKEFPVTQRKTYLAHAGLSPLPRRVCSAMQEYCESAACWDDNVFHYAEIENNARRHTAEFLGVNEDEIAFVTSTSMGLAFVAEGLDWRKWDNILVADGDFPANVNPWVNLGRKSIEVRSIPRRLDGSITLEDIQEAIDENTRLVSLSSVHYITGYRIDTRVIGEFLHKKGILFCVDGAQSFGQCTIDMKYVDFMAASAHKWLMGPAGTGILYVNKRHLNSLRPVLCGWKNVEDCHDYLCYTHPFLASAQKYEPGTLNGVGITGLNAALGLLIELGIEHVEARISMLRRMIVHFLLEKGYEIEGSNEANQSAGIVTFYPDGKDIRKIRQTFEKEGIMVSYRDNLAEEKCVRLSPHFYNTEEEIFKVMAFL